MECIWYQDSLIINV
jgi:hypothetical protein